MKKKSLSLKTSLGVIVFAALIMVGTCIAIVFQYKNDLINRYSERVTTYALTTAEFIDGDTISTYLETKEKDDYYKEVQNYLDAFLNNSDVQYMYVVVPEEEGLVYIWDGHVKGVKTEIGEFEAYVDGGKEIATDAFSKTPKLTPIVSDEKYGYIATVVAPIYDSEGEPVALVGVDISMEDISETIMYFIINVSVVNVIVVAVFSVFLLAYVRKQLLKPIDVLNEATHAMVENLENDINVEIDVHTQDEIDELARSFETMNSEVKEYISKLSKATAEKERIGAELDVATKIQISMLPSIFPPFPERKDVDIFASTCPAKEVGGDFYDFFLVDDNHLAVVMADVSGKGVPAALFMVIAKTLLKNRCQLSHETPAQTLAFVNNQLCENNDQMMFVTVWLGILDLTTGLLTASNAGHEFPVLKKAGGKFEVIEDQHGFVLAALEGSQYTNYQVQLEPGDMLYLYTDGVPEATDENEVFYGMDRMVTALNSIEADSCKGIVEAMSADIDAFVNSSEQYDDVTQLVLTYFGPK